MPSPGGGALKKLGVRHVSAECRPIADRRQELLPASGVRKRLEDVSYKGNLHALIHQKVIKPSSGSLYKPSSEVVKSAQVRL